MNETKYIWQDGKLVDWQDAKVHVLIHGLHYGTAVFEGIRFYDLGSKSAIFRLEEHVTRLIYSARALEMEVGYSADELIEAILLTCKENEIKEGYIRPLIFYGYGKMGLNPKGAPVSVVIATWPWGTYLGKEMVDIKTSSYIRIHPKSLVSDAKVSGHYVNSVMASLEMGRLGYDEALLMDYQGNVAEGPGENIFIVKDNKVFTVKLGNILAGITRSAAMDLLSSEMGLDILEKDLTLEEVLDADEAFFTGTAAEIQPISSINDQKIGNGQVGQITAKLKDLFTDVVHGKNEKYKKWLTEIN